MKPKITSNERALNQAMRQAGWAAIKLHFSGEGRASRSALFLRDGLERSMTWSLVFASLICTSMVLGVTVGPGHETLLKAFHAWMAATPVDLVVSNARSWVVDFGSQCIVGGLVAGFVQKLIGLAKPAMEFSRSESRSELVSRKS